jgi:truncated hemoglobin YjbI
MRITGTEFDLLAQDLATTLDEFGVPEKEKHELLNAVASTKPDIINK